MIMRWRMHRMTLAEVHLGSLQAIWHNNCLKVSAAKAELSMFDLVKFVNAIAGDNAAVSLNLVECCGALVC